MHMQTDRPSTSTKDDSVAFSYKAEPPRPDLLDYRYMAIEMNRMSEPGKVWITILAGIVVIGLCLLSLWVERILWFLLRG